MLIRQVILILQIAPQILVPNLLHSRLVCQRLNLVCSHQDNHQDNLVDNLVVNLLQIRLLYLPQFQLQCQHHNLVDVLVVDHQDNQVVNLVQYLH